MSARALPLPWAARSKGRKGKAKARKRRAANLPAEYNLLLTATL
jgi:hypothetical protein